MDDILKRMLAVERQAQEIVRRAEEQAESIQAQGRREATAFEERARQEMAAEAEQVVRQRVAEAEQEKARVLAAGEPELQRRVAEFRLALLARRSFLVSALGYPMSSEAAADQTQPPHQPAGLSPA